MAKTVLKNTNQEAVVKITGVGTETIDLQTDILAATQALDGETQSVNIIGIQFTGLATSTITIVRGGTTVTSLSAEGNEYVEFGAGYSETTSNTADIVVTIGTANAQAYITLRKVGGYATKVETATYGAYDDPTRVGASTTMSGSPDKV
jgi:hypothetical protein